MLLTVTIGQTSVEGEPASEMASSDEGEWLTEVQSGSGGGFEQFGKDAQWFRRLLTSKGVLVIGGSEMDRALKAMTRITEVVESTPVEDGAEKLEILLQDETGRANLERLILDGVGGANLVRTVRKALDADAAVFDGKWDLFRGPDVILARYLKRTAERDLTWELFIAALCVHAANDVKIAQNDNPDIRCRIRDITWGVECKVFDSSKLEKQLERVKEGIRQLQDSDVDRGFVAVNLTSVIDRSRFRQSIRTFGTPLFTEADIMADLQRQVTALVRPFTEIGFHRWSARFQKTRALSFHASTICLAGKILSLTTVRTWVDLHRPEPVDLIKLVRWPHPLDQAMSNRFQRAADKF
jgi:hypothetical protein